MRCTAAAVAAGLIALTQTPPAHADIVEPAAASVPKPTLAGAASRVIAVAADEAMPSPSATRAACANNTTAIGTARTVEIDTSTGPLFGRITKQTKEPSFLKPKEVVLTFDDGPVPWITKPILDTLAAHCARATFFSVGRMALAYPKTLKAAVEAGHTVGSHTWSHPLNLRRLGTKRAIAQIERGFSAVSAAVDGDVVPFFRFPGLSDSPALLEHLQERGIATFTVDVVSDDSFIKDADELAKTTLARIRATNGGIVLFHDIKKATATALPVILDTLAREGFKVVHMRSRQRFKPHEDFPVPALDKDNPPPIAHLKPSLSDASPPTKEALKMRALVPMSGMAALVRALDPATKDRPVNVISSPPRQRIRSK